MKIGLVIVKAVGNQCNLRCLYCYAPPTVRKTVMSAQTLKQTIKRIATLNPMPIYFWGGREPLLVGKKFFENVLHLQSFYCHNSPINSLQTNGLLLNSAWIEFFQKNNFQVGISWDGDVDSARVTLTGQTINHQIWRAIELCLKEGLRFGVITVVTRQNIKQLPQIAKTLYSRGIKDLLFKPYIGPATDLSLESPDYGEAMCRLLDLWLATKDTEWKIEPLYSFVRALLVILSGLPVSLLTIVVIF